MRLLHRATCTMAEVPLPTPTQVPVPSTDIRNAVFAGAKLDEEVTGSGEYYTDRLGVKRLTNTGRNNKFNAAQQERESRFDAFIQSSGYEVIGDYTAGPLTITEYNQLIRYNNELYKLTAATDLPFTTAGNTDQTWTATDSSHFVSVGDAALRQNLASAEEGLGDNLVARNKGGTVHDAIPAYYVDAYGADPFGLTSSTAAVSAALAAINSETDSTITGQEDKLARLIFGNGRYLVKDLLIKSNIVIEGQDSTILIPEAGGSFIFDTVGTEPYNTGGAAKRLFRPVFRSLKFGCGIQDQFPGVSMPQNVGGIRLAHASYATLENVEFRYLDGTALMMESVWDSDLHNVRIMYCGNARNTTDIKCGLDINAGNDTVDGANAIRIRGLHIESCAKLLNIGPRSRHIFLESPKLEAQEADAKSCTIKDARGITFDTPELTWGRSDSFMFDMTGPNQLISFESPSLISSLSKIGNYFIYDSTLGTLSINNVQMRGVRQLVNGSNYKVSGGTGYLSGPVLIDGTSNVTVENLDLRGITQPAGGSTAPCIQVNGPGCKITENKLHFGGSASDGFVGVYVGPLAIDAQVTNNLFSGSRSTALSIAASAVPGSTLYGNRVVDSGSFTTLVSGSKPAFPVLHTGTPPQKYPFEFPDAVTLAPNAAYTFSGLTTSSLLLFAASWTFSSALYSESALVLMNNSAAAVHVLNSLRGMILDGSGGMTGAYIYITKSGNNYTVTNRYTETVTIKIAAINL